MELLSSLAKGGDSTSEEGLLSEWRNGVYKCSQCDERVFDSQDKWKGPCAWASFRKVRSAELVKCENYNNYTCDVRELYVCRASEASKSWDRK